MFRRWIGLAALVAFVVAAASGAAFAQAAQASAPAKQAALPTGESLMTKYVEALGGQAAFDKIDNRVAQGSLDLGAMGITMSLSVYAAKPDRLYSIVDSDATGRIESGVVDGIVWENSAMRGAIVKEGAEKDDVLRDAAFDRMVYWKPSTKSVECVGVADVDGKPAYKVVLTPKTGSAQTIYFDRETGLAVQIETRMAAAGQVIDIVSKPGDYRVLDGVKIPFTIKQYLMGQERVITLQSVEHNVSLPADRFALPAAIKALVEKR